jgi:hypothetical protein
MNEEMRQIEVTIEQCEEQVALLECYERLKDNPDFQTLILHNLMEQEAIRAVKAEADENLTPEGKQGMKNIRVCIGQLDNYFRKVNIFGNAAKRALAEDKITREELLKEDLEGSVLEAGSIQ